MRLPREGCSAACAAGSRVREARRTSAAASPLPRLLHRHQCSCMSSAPCTGTVPTTCAISSRLTNACTPAAATHIPPSDHLVCLSLIPLLVCRLSMERLQLQITSCNNASLSGLSSLQEHSNSTPVSGFPGNLPCGGVSWLDSFH